MTRWVDPQPVNADSLELLSLHPLVAQTLIRRGIQTAEAARAFLDPLHAGLRPAFELPGMQAAAERISQAIRAGEPICVWGDFDVDGQTATTILVQTLQALGADVTYHIPIRATENHGVNLENLAPILDHGAKLILTCDTGISAHEAVEYARSRAVDFVITDHHELPEELPEAAAVTNPKLLPEEHPLANLPGAGVAYKLAETLLLAPDSLLDLAALGIVADLALLKGETRSIVQRGLEALRAANRLGLKAIMELAGLDPAQLKEEHISFILAPRLNALGRLADANPAVELLTTRDPARARLLAAQIEGLNTQRKLLTSQVHQAAEAQLRADPSLLTQPVIILGHPSWPGGVIGIVANQLVERYHKPVILLSAPQGEPVRGSARSVEGLHITQAIAAHKDLLLSFGGHPMAAGLSLDADKLADFRRALGKTVEKMLGKARFEEPTLQIDAWLPLSSLSIDLASEVEKLAPFGPGNPALTFGARGLTLQSAAPIGRGKEHLKLTVEAEDNETQEILWWNGAGEELPDGKFDLAFSLRAGTFRGARQLTLEFVDFRIIEERPREVRERHIEIVDWRGSTKRPENVQAWAEAESGKKVNGTDRYGLVPSKELAIWTTPPGPSELQSVLEKVKPEKVYLIAVSPPEEETEEFLRRLTGMTKFVMNQRGGKTGLSELAAATAQREATVRLGLEWLAAGGHLAIRAEENELRFSAGNGIANTYLQQELYIAVKGLLEETAAYRAYFARAEAKSLIEF